MLDLDPSRSPATPRAASTVIVLRDGERGLEVFSVRRTTKASFLGGALVFPGGKVDEADRDPGWSELSTDPHPRAVTFASETDTPKTLAIAACRETLEESTILPFRRSTATVDLERLSKEVREGTDFLIVARREGLCLSLSELVPWARWITPEAEPRRFDARFFLLPLPDSQTGKHDEVETTMSFWASPSEVLERAVRGEFFLAPPTARTLELLSMTSDVRGALELAGRQSLKPICPKFVSSEFDAPFLALPGDPAHEIDEKRVDGPTRYVFREGRFVSEDPSRRD